MQLRHVHEFVIVAPFKTSAQFASGAIVSGTVVVVVVVVVVVALLTVVVVEVVVVVVVVVLVVVNEGSIAHTRDPIIVG